MLDIAIVGTGVVSALGCSPKEYHARMMAGECAIRAAPWDAGPGKHAWWAMIDDFNAADWMDPKLIDGTDVFAQYAFATAKQALAEADLGALDAERTAIVHGVSMGGVRALTLAQHKLETEGPAAIPRKTEIQIYPNMAASQIAMAHQLHGPSLTVTTACAASLDALGQAAQMIHYGQVDVAIAGATDGGLTIAGDPGFTPAVFYTSTLYGMVAPATDPRRAMLPFDANRRGIVVGEGSAMFILENGARARARGARILGYIRGYGTLADAYHPSSPDPTGRWEARAMEKALASAGIEAGQVDALIAHATGTPKGDTAEINAINMVHGDRAKPLPAASIKGHIGHSGAASGAMALVTGLLGMAEDRFIFNCNTTDPDPEARFDVVIEKPREMRVDTLQLNSFGFGGQNASMIVTKT
ncbi:beta-ketoacyl-[acyl-carrier-protein] synthase family protein [Chelatococcus reniformis]|uniref:3-oxoacyl-[acyl-carrier-protein] synthase 2 n=1 Tax=Chelatococcus reniformis TaxID=1494448 RepID=A0A916UB27_9HYPH|nr:beta-ketoacyl-[acyl-carrier-protein] synthase family protein [Chelatococcus reniformis]GGC66388.1 3-oxoacyl-[acyl-carrier-protein] synthase 2 [Chelatococcus reniformis]